MASSGIDPVSVFSSAGVELAGMLASYMYMFHGICAFALQIHLHQAGEPVEGQPISTESYPAVGRANAQSLISGTECEKLQGPGLENLHGLIVLRL